jgi:hypothetical protein
MIVRVCLYGDMSLYFLSLTLNVIPDTNLGWAEGRTTGASNLFPITSAIIVPLALILLYEPVVYCFTARSVVGTDGREIEMPKTAPRTVRGSPRRTKGAAIRKCRLLAKSNTSYPPPATNASPVYKKVDEGVLRTDTKRGSSAGAGSISKGATKSEREKE